MSATPTPVTASAPGPVTGEFDGSPKKFHIRTSSSAGSPRTLSAASLGVRGLDLSTLPDAARVLLEPFDVDRSGVLDASEVLLAANMLAESRSHATTLRRTLIVGAVVFLLFLGCFFGLVFAVVELGKEVKSSSTSGDLISTRTGEVVHVSSTTKVYPISVTSAWSDADLASVTSVEVLTQDGTATLHSQVTGFARLQDTRVVFFAPNAHFPFIVADASGLTLPMAANTSALARAVEASYSYAGSAGRVARQLGSTTNAGASKPMAVQTNVGNSDRRLKKDIADVEGPLSLSAVLALRPVTYNWIDAERATINPGHKELGFIAQEVEAVLPAVVRTHADAMGSKSIAYDRIVSVLVGAVQELAAEVQGLKEQLASAAAAAKDL